MKHQSTFNRLRRIEGQIRGIEEMIAKDRLERDILIQLDAARSSLDSTIANIIKEMLTSDEKGQVVLKETDVNSILRFVKK